MDEANSGNLDVAEEECREVAIGQLFNIVGDVRKVVPELQDIASEVHARDALNTFSVAIELPLDAKREVARHVVAITTQETRDEDGVRQRVEYLLTGLLSRRNAEDIGTREDGSDAKLVTIVGADEPLTELTFLNQRMILCTDAFEVKKASREGTLALRFFGQGEERRDNPVAEFVFLQQGAMLVQVVILHGFEQGREQLHQADRFDGNVVLTSRNRGRANALLGSHQCLASQVGQERLQFVQTDGILHPTVRGTAVSLVLHVGGGIGSCRTATRVSLEALTICHVLPTIAIGQIGGQVNEPRVHSQDRLSHLTSQRCGIDVGIAPTETLQGEHLVAVLLQPGGLVITCWVRERAIWVGREQSRAGNTIVDKGAQFLLFQSVGAVCAVTTLHKEAQHQPATVAALQGGNLRVLTLYGEVADARQFHTGGLCSSLERFLQCPIGNSYLVLIHNLIQP